MAARENQGYLIAVIVLVLLSLVLALVSFLGVQKAYEQADASRATEAKLAVSGLIAQAEGLKGEAYKAIIGGLGTAPSELEKTVGDLNRIAGNPALSADNKKLITDIIAEVEAAQAAYKVETGTTINNAGDGEATVATLRSRITDLISLVDRMRKEFVIQVRETDEAAADAARKIAQTQETLDSTIKEMENLNEKLIAEKEASLVKENKLKEEVAESKKAIADVTRVSEEAAQQAAASIREGKNQIALLEVDNVNLKTKLNQFTNQVFDNADGQIIKVASALNTVFVDIGRNDGLTNNRTFSVYDQSVTDFETAKVKGTIEIVRVDTFRSEARVTFENPVDPILRGDHILTATWDPGFTVQIALAGRFDLDGDRYDDTEKLIRMIERNGGRVAASHDQKGNVNGKISPDVRYLVRGNKSLIDGDDDADAGKILNVLRQFEADAVKNTVQVIDLQKLLNRMGVRSQPKTEQIDLPAGGFVPRSPGSANGSGSKGSGSKGSDTRGSVSGSTSR